MDNNFREAENLMLRIERLVEEDEGQGREIFLFTNIVLEVTYYKRYSNSEKLSDIILRLHGSKVRSFKVTCGPYIRNPDERVGG